MKRFAITLVALGLCLGPTADAHAGPAVQGGIVTSGVGLFSACSITCRDFFVVGCPESMETAVGVDRSIVDVSRFAGHTLTFNWSASSTAVYQAIGDAADRPSGSQVFFYLVSSCNPPFGPSFALTNRPAELTKTVTIPDGTRWLIVETDTAQDLTWWATDDGQS